MPRPAWILLSSRLPREPSRLRLAVWRRLKRARAVLLHDTVWVLPADAATREAVEWLAEEIEEAGGTAFVWEGASLSSEQDRHIVAHFRREAEARYAEIEASARAIRDAVLRGRRRGARAPVPEPAVLAHGLRQLRGLERALRLERRRDHFGAPGRAAAAAVVGAAVEALQQRGPPARERRPAHALGH